MKVQLSIIPEAEEEYDENGNLPKLSLEQAREKLEKKQFEVRRLQDYIATIDPFESQRKIMLTGDETQRNNEETAREFEQKVVSSDGQKDMPDILAGDKEEDGQEQKGESELLKSGDVGQDSPGVVCYETEEREDKDRNISESILLQSNNDSSQKTGLQIDATPDKTVDVDRNTESKLIQVSGSKS